MPYYKNLNSDSERLSKLDVQLTVRLIRKNREFFKDISTPANRVIDRRFFDLLYAMNYTRNINSHLGEDCSDEDRVNAINLMVEIGSYINSNASQIIHTPTSKKQDPSPSYKDLIDDKPIIPKNSYSHALQSKHYDWKINSEGIKSRFGLYYFDKLISAHAYLEQNEWFPLDDFKSFSGIARISYIDGSYYQGEILNGQRNGLGFMVNSQGDFIQNGLYYFDDFIGEIFGLTSNSILCNKNMSHVKIVSRNYTYEGDFRDGAINGRGIRRFKNGQIENGIFCNYKFLGDIIHLYPDSKEQFDLSKLSEYCGKIYIERKGKEGTSNRTTTYSGEWNDGKMEGSGKYVEEGNFEYYGNWKDNHPHGYGHLKFVNGDRYEGNFFNGLFHGKKAKFIYNDKSFYIGGFTFGNRQGYGEFHKSGYVFKGEWVNNHMNGHITVYNGQNSIVLEFDLVDNKCAKKFPMINSKIRSILDFFNIIYTVSSYEISPNNDNKLVDNFNNESKMISAFNNDINWNDISW